MVLAPSFLAYLDYSFNLKMKVTRQLYNEIKARLQEAPGYTQKEVGKMVGVAQSTVDRVVKSRNYKNYHEVIKEHNLRQAKLREYRAYTALPDSYESKTVNKKELLRLVKEISRHMDNIHALLKQLKGGLK